MTASARLAGLALMIAGCSGAPLGERAISVALTYGDGTNFGPETASGTAMIDTPTGQVDVSVIGLPMLDGDLYEGWLAGGGENATSTGKFNVGPGGDGSSTVVLGDLRERTFERVFLTVEADPDPCPEPDVRQSIGGDIPD